MGISLIGRHVATEQSGLPRPPHNQVRFSNSSYLMEMLELRMSMLFEDASDDNDENASYVEEKDDVNEREYDLGHILQRIRMKLMKENMIWLISCIRRTAANAFYLPCNGYCLNITPFKAVLTFRLFLFNEKIFSSHP